MSILSMVQFLTISSAASCGMMSSRAWTRARAASISRYFWVRFSSDHTVRMASVLKILPKMAESTIVEGMIQAFLCQEEFSGIGAGKDRLSFQQHRPIHHPAIHLDGAGSGFSRGDHAPRPVLFRRSGSQCLPDGGDLPGVDAQLGGEAEGAGEIQIALQRVGIVDGRSDTRDRCRLF